MKEEHQNFRRSYFESVPSVIPLGIAIVSLIMAVKTFMGEVDLPDLPVQYATSALFVSLAGLAFSFYVSV